MGNVVRPTLDHVVRELEIRDAAENLRARWAETSADFTPTGLAFLEQAYLTKACRTLKLDEDIAEAILQTGHAIDRSPPLKRLAWHLHCTELTDRGVSLGVSVPPLAAWPKLPETWMRKAGMFHVVVLLSVLPALRAFYRERRIPDAVFDQTMGDLARNIRAFQKNRGYLGLDLFPAGARWFRSHHFTGMLFQLGRLQFNFHPFGYDLHAYRHTAKREVVLLAGDQMRFDDAGRSAQADDKEAWTAAFHADAKTIRGHRLTPETGRAARSLVNLPAGLWQPILGKGDPVLGVHIHAAQPMAHDQCGESFRRAMEFFPRHFPEYEIRAFTCSSWLLDHQFAKYLSPKSNIVRFLSEYYLFPFKPPSPKEQARFFGVAFGRPLEELDLDTEPQNTSLQRAIVEHVKIGGQWHSGGGVIFPEEVSDWGAQPYRQASDNHP